MFQDRKFILLSIALFFQTLGYFLFSFFWINSLNQFLFIELDLKEIYVNYINYFLSSLLLFAGFYNLLKESSFWILYISLYILVLVLLESFIVGTWHKEMGVFTSAVRYLAPISMCLLLQNKRIFFNERFSIAYFVLILGLSLTFLFHGLKALLGYSLYLDYIIIVSDIYLALDFSEGIAHFLLKMIGFFDILFAFFLLTSLRKWALIYMLICATSSHQLFL